MGISKDGRARIIRQRLILLRQVQGIPFVESSKLWLLSRTKERPKDPVRLAELLLGEEEPSKEELAELLSADEIIAIDERVLNGWSRASELVGSWRDIESLMAEGVRGLRRWTPEEVREIALQSRHKVDNLYEIFRYLGERGRKTFIADPIERCCSRLLGYFEDEEFAARVRKLLTSPIAESKDSRRSFISRVKRFLQLIEIAKRDSSYHSKNQREQHLVLEVREQLKRRKLNPQFLSRMLAKWLECVGDGERPLSLRELTRTIRKNWVSDLRQAISAGADLWLEAREKKKQSRENLMIWQVAVLLANRHLAMDIPVDFTSQQYRRLIDLVSKVSEERAPLFQDMFMSMASRTDVHLDPRLFNSNLDRETIEKIYDLDCYAGAVQLREDLGAVNRYVEAVEKLQGLEIKDKDYLQSDWFLSLFRNALMTSSALPLVMLTRERSNRVNVDDVASLYALTRGLVSHRDLLSAPLDQWTNPKLEEEPAQFTKVLKELNVEVQELAKYVAYRQILGKERPFSKELLSLLNQRGKEEREIAYLRRFLSGDGLTEERRAHFERRLASLESEDGRARRNRGALKRAHRLFERSMIELSRQSLNIVLDRVYLQLLSELLGKPLKGPLPKGLREALQLVATDNRNFSLFLELLIHIVDSKDISLREENRKWLEKARLNGLDVAKWLAGLDRRVAAQGSGFTFSTEHSPLEILKMGTYFGTCLALDDGFNAASTVLNALDANKQVIYARDEKGSVIGRKLICATSGGRAIAYETYGFSDFPTLQTTFDLAIAAYCEDCGLNLQDKGKAEKIHQGFWYDDGSVNWRRQAGCELGPLPPSIPQTNEAGLEFHFSRGLRENDLERLAAIGNEAPSTTSLEDSVALRLWTANPQRAFEYCRLQPWADWGTVIECLINKGAVGWLRNPHLRKLETVCQRLLENGFNSIPLEEGLISLVVDELLRFTEKFAKSISGYGHDFQPPMRLAQMPVKTILSLLEATLRVLPKRFFENVEDWPLVWCDIVYFAYLREGKARDLVGFLRKGLEMTIDVIAHTASRVKIPGSADGLKAHLGSALGKRRDRLAIALGTQGRKKDGPFLLGLLESNRHNITLAVAVTRTGHEEASSRARDIWRPAPSLSSLNCDEKVLSLIRELDGDKYPQRLRRLRKRLEGDGEENSVLTEKQVNLLLAQIGRLCDCEEADRPAPFCQQQVSLLPKMRKLLAGNEEEQVSACQWMLSSCNAKLNIRDDELERTFDQLIANGTDNATLLDIWFRTRFPLSAEHFIALAGRRAVNKLPFDTIEEYLDKRLHNVYKAVEFDRFLLFLAALPKERALPWMRGWHVHGECQRSLEDEYFGGQLTQFIEDEAHELSTTARELVVASGLCEGLEVQIVLDDLRLWMKPTTWEQLAKDTLQAWRKNQPAKDHVAKFMVKVKSYRLMELFIHIVWSQLEEEMRQSLVKSFDDEKTGPHHSWFLHKLGDTTGYSSSDMCVIVSGRRV